MNKENQKTVLRMIPYGMYILMADDGKSFVASSVSWVNQVSFKPPLISIALKVDSQTYQVVKNVSLFSLNILGKEQVKVAPKFFKHQEPQGNIIADEPFERTSQRTPVLQNVLGWLECEVINFLQNGDHCVFISQVKQAKVVSRIESRPDSYTLMVSDLGSKMFYGG